MRRNVRWNDFIVDSIRAEYKKHWSDYISYPSAMKLYTVCGSVGKVLLAIQLTAKQEQEKETVRNRYAYILAILKKRNWLDRDLDFCKKVDRLHSQWFIRNYDGNEISGANFIKQLSESFGVVDDKQKHERKIDKSCHGTGSPA